MSILAVTIAPAKAGGLEWYGELAGFKVVPANSSAATGLAIVTATSTTITCHIFSSVPTGTARIHSGAPETTGPSIGTILPYNTLGEWYGTIPATAADLADLGANHLYVEVTADQSSDVVRGQLITTWETSGTGCAGAAGVPWVLCGQLPAPASMLAPVTIGNGAPNAPAIVLINTLPASLPLRGGCTLLVDPVAPAIWPVKLTGLGTYVSFPPVVLPVTLPTPLDLHVQLFVLDPTAANGQYSASARLTMHLSNFPD